MMSFWCWFWSRHEWGYCWHGRVCPEPDSYLFVWQCRRCRKISIRRGDSNDTLKPKPDEYV